MAELIPNPAPVGSIGPKGPSGAPGDPGPQGPPGIPDPTPAPAPAPAEPPKPEPPASKVVTKELFDKTASELAKAKKMLQERMTADELAEAKAEEARMELETLRKERQMAKLEVSLAKSGVENCAEIAELFAGGKTEDAIVALSSAKDAQIKKLQDEITTLKLRGAEKPPTGEANDKFAGKSLAELMQMANADPAQEKQIAQYLDSKNKKE